MKTLIAMLVMMTAGYAQSKPNISAEFSKTALKALLSTQANYTGTDAQTARMQDAVENAEVAAHTPTEKEIVESLTRYDKEQLAPFRKANAKIAELDKTLTDAQVYKDPCGDALKTELTGRVWSGYPDVCILKKKEAK